MTQIKFENIKACVFDAYGTLFNVHAAVGQHREKLGDKADLVSALWRTKQLEYTWLRSLMGKYTEFWQVTTDALDYALDAHNIDDQDLRVKLLDAYWVLDPYPEVKETLTQLVQAGLKCAILSNGSPAMLEAAVKNAGIEDLLVGVYSVEEVGIYKPDPRVYELVTRHLGVEKNEVSFQSSNAWDAYAARAFGFKVAWVNRFGQGKERLPEQPNTEIDSLKELPPIVIQQNHDKGN